MLLEIAKRAIGLDDLKVEDLDSLNTGVSASGELVAQHTALTLSSVASAVDFLAKSASAMVLNVFYEDGSPIPYAEKPRWAKLMPSPFDRATTFRHRTVASLALPGNAYWWVLTRNRDGYPDAVMCLPPSQVSVTDNNGVLSYEVTMANGEHQELSSFSPYLPFGDIVHTKWWDDGTPEGLSPLEIGQDVIGVGLSVQKAAASYWKGGGLPAGIISPPKTGQPSVGRKNIEKLRRIFAVEQSSRSKNEPQFVTVPVEWTPIGLTPQQLQLIEARKFTVEEIARLYRLPPHILSHSDTKTWGSSVYQMNQWAFGIALGPYIALLEESYNMLLPDGQYTKMDGSFLLRPDRKTRYEAYEIAITAGFMTRNEARELEDLIRLDGLDEPLDPGVFRPRGPRQGRTDARPANTPV